jgi:prevent-host-death family protein
VQVDIHHAKARLCKLIAAAKNGEEVILARAGKPVAKLVPVRERASEPASETARKSRQDMMGAGIGKLWMADDFDSPATSLEIQRLFEGERY